MKKPFYESKPTSWRELELVRTFYLMVARVSFILNQPFLPVEIEQCSKMSRALYFIYETEKHYYLQNYGQAYEASNNINLGVIQRNPIKLVFIYYKALTL